MKRAVMSPLWTERPLFINSNGHSLFGILAEPAREERGEAVIHLRGGNPGPSSGRNRTSARLGRQLAAQGFHALRFDYHGVGESTGEIERFRLDEPFKEDVEAWVGWLHEAGLSRVALIGECFGARTAIACHDLPGLAAVVLVAAPVRDAEKVDGTTRPLVRHRSLLGYARRAAKLETLKAMMDATKRRKYLHAAHAAWRAKPYREGGISGPTPGWVSPAFLQGIDALAARKLPILFVNGAGDPGIEDFDRARSGTLGGILSESAQHIRIELLDGRIAACADADLQEPAIDLMTSWLSAALADGGLQTQGTHLFTPRRDGGSA